MTSLGEERDVDSHVFCVAELGTSLAVEPSLLGSSAAIRAGEFGARLYLPRLEWREDGSPVIGPSAPEWLPTDQQERWAWKGCWGSVPRWKDRTIDIAYVSRCVVAIEAPPTSQVQICGDFESSIAGGPAVGAFMNAVDAWMVRMRPWAAVVARQSTDPESPIHALGNHPQRVIPYALGPTGTITGGGRTMVIKIVLDREYTFAKPLEAETWAAVCRCASEARSIPLARQMLATARTAWHRNETRRAAIEACTAVEITLREEHDRLLNPLGDNKRMLEGFLPIGTLITRLKKVQGHRLPKDLLACVVVPRNEAAHAGSEIPKDVAHRAIELAQSVVDEFEPLDI